MRDDVRKGHVSRQKAHSEYGVVLTDALALDEEATLTRRTQLRAEREAAGGLKDFDFGPSLEEILAQAREQTGLEPPEPPRQLSWVPMEESSQAMQRVRDQDNHQMSLAE